MSVETNSIDFFYNLENTVKVALEEDIGSGDITAMLIPSTQESHAKVITREEAIVCGRPWFDEVFKQLDPSIKVNWLKDEGELAKPNETLVELSGQARSLLTGERAALNFLQTLMGTATTSSLYAKLVEGTNTKMLDTRKTIPGLRLAQKYAIKVGGCDNHRIGLYDAFLIKENHIQACGGIAQAIATAKNIAPDKKVEVEVETIAELAEALKHDADIIMLDNFNEPNLIKAKQLKTNQVKYELSGNLDINSFNPGNIDKIDFVSSGALTKHCKATDLSMRFTQK